MAFQESVDDAMLKRVHDQRNNPFGIPEVPDIVFPCSPECEVIGVSEIAESFSGIFDGRGAEDDKGGFSLPETLNFGKILHLERKEEGNVRNGSDMKPESVTGGFTS